MKKTYPVLLTLQKERVLIEVPDFKILAEAKDREEACIIAKNAIQSKWNTMKEAQEKIPQPSCINELDIENATYLNEGITVIMLVDIDCE